jgi:N-acetylglucosaminyl-diphospho-decaprenol L-rhamnosyltransferase
MIDRARWAAVVVNYESGPLLVDAVDSLLADTSAGEPEVVVVDNGSEDGSIDRLRATRPDVPVVPTGGNLGYAAAANRGAAATRAPVVAVCNCDIRVRAGTAAVLLARFDDERDIGAVGPVVRDTDGTHYPSARAVPQLRDAVGHAVLGGVRPRNRFTRRYRELDADANTARDVDWVSGAAIWLRRDALDDVGGWDERYFMYVEDVDLCRRLRDHEWRVVHEPAGQVVHVHGASTARHPYRMIAEHHRSLLRFARSRWSGPRRVLLVPAAAFLGIRAGVAMGWQAVRHGAGRPRRGADRATG